MRIRIKKPTALAAQEVLELARDYIRRGHCVVPIPFRQKNPIRKGWTKLRITDKTVVDYFGGEVCNIGVHWGEASGGWVDVDLDCAEAVTLASNFLPKTARYGRESRPNSHWIYHAPGARTLKWTDPEHGMLIELRADRHQSVVPGSVHPSGERVRWDEDCAPTTVEPADLITALSRLASASLLLRRWTKHSRDDLCTALVGFLLRSGWSSPETASFIDLLATTTGDEERSSRLSKIERLARNLERNPGGHFKFPHSWPGQVPPLDNDGMRG